MLLAVCTQNRDLKYLRPKIELVRHGRAFAGSCVDTGCIEFLLRAAGNEPAIKSSKLLLIVPKFDLVKHPLRKQASPRCKPRSGRRAESMGKFAQGSTFLFDGFHLDQRGLFRRDERGALTPVPLGGRALDLLGVLVERHGELLSKAEIMAAVWPKAVVEDGNLTLQISALRRVVGASSIQTVARRGYRFAAAVTLVEPEGSQGHLPISEGRASPAPRLSIVVLPFSNLSGDPGQEYFTDGFTDDLTTDLSRIADSFVIARSTAFTYKGKAIDVRQIGRELGVRYVLEGSLQRSGRRIRMNLQLIDAETGGHLWAERLETDRENLAQTEDEIIGRLAHTLNLELVADASRRIRLEGASDPDARDLIMRGWGWFYRPRSAANFQAAQRAFERALVLRPQSRTARIGLARVLAATTLEGWSRSPSQDQARIEELLAEVSVRGTHHAMAHYAMAMLRRSQNRVTEARIAAERAVALDHNNAAALYELGLAEMYLGRPAAAVPQIEKAIRLSPRDPLLSAMQYGLGRCHLFLGRRDEAIELFERVRGARSGFWDVHMWLAGALALNGDLDAARAMLAAARSLKPNILSLAQWRGYQPWITIPQYRALREKTLYLGLRCAGFPDE
jgi:TolB-like protein